MKEKSDISPSSFRQRIRQFFAAMKATLFGLPKKEILYAREHLSPKEFSLWQSQTAADCAHSLAVAHTIENFAAEKIKGGSTPPPKIEWSLLLRAALLHDVGRGRFGTPFAKTIAVLFAAFFPEKSRHLAEEKTGGYLAALCHHHYFHAAIGADLVEKTGEANSGKIAALIARHHDAPRPDDTAEIRLLRQADARN